MQRPTIALASIESSGPKEHPQPDGTVYRQTTPCHVCDGTIDTGEAISRVGGRWAHRDCAKTCVDTAEVRTAWALLGEDVARNPRAYKARDVRTIVENLAGLVHEQVYRDEVAVSDDLT